MWNQLLSEFKISKLTVSRKIWETENFSNLHAVLNKIENVLTCNELVILECQFCVLTPCTFLPMTTSEKPHGIWRHYFYHTRYHQIFFQHLYFETLPLIDSVCILLNILPNIMLGAHCRNFRKYLHTQFYMKSVFFELTLLVIVILWKIDFT